MGLTVAELEQEIVSQGAAQTGLLAEIVDARGTARTLGARLDVALNPDGTLRTSVTAAAFVTEVAPIIAYPPAGEYVAFKGDLTAVYVAKRRLRINGALLPYVISSTYDAGGDYTVVNFSTPVGYPITSVEYSFDPAAMPPIHYSGNPDIEQVVSGISTFATKHLSDAQYKSLLDDILARVTITSLASVDDGAGVDLVGRAFKYVDIIDDLRILTPTDAPVYVQGRTTIDDGGHGTFVWSTADLSAKVAADTLHGIYVAPTSDPTGASGAWVRQYSGYCLTSWWGDDEDALQLAHDIVGGRIVVNTSITTTRQYTITKDDVVIEFAPGIVITAGADLASATTGMFHITGDGVQINNPRLDGNHYSLSGITTGALTRLDISGGEIQNFDTPTSFGILIGASSTATTKVSVIGVDIHSNDAGIRIGGAAGSINHAVIERCYVHNNNDRGIEFVADGGSISKNFITQNGVSELYVSGGGSAAWGKLTVDGNIIISDSTSPVIGIKLSSGTTNYRLVNNYIDTSATPYNPSYYTLFLQGTSDGIVENNTIIGGASGALYIAPHPDPNGSDSKNVVISKNKIQSDAAICVSYLNTAAGGFVGSEYKFLNNEFSGASSTVINGTAENVVIHKNKFPGSAKTQNIMRVFGGGLEVSNNKFGACSRSAILYENNTVSDSLNSKIINNTLVADATSASTYGRIQIISDPAEAFNIQDLEISNNTVIGGRYGILVGTYAAVSDSSTGVVIKGNTIKKTAFDGIRTKSGGTVINNNILRDYSTGSSSYSGIAVIGDASTVMGNQLESATKFAHINVVSGAGNRLIYNFMNTNSIVDSGTSTVNTGNVYP